MDENWLSASQALRMVQVSNDRLGAIFRITKRAHAGMVHAKAERFIRDGVIFENAKLPVEFWWTEGGSGMVQDWQSGDFETLIDRSERWRALGVRFLRTDIETIVALLSDALDQAAGAPPKIEAVEPTSTTQSEQPPSPRAGAKPTKRQAVERYIAQNFPDGLPAGLSYKQIAQAVGREIGDTVDERTVRRARGKR